MKNGWASKFIWRRLKIIAIKTIRSHHDFWSVKQTKNSVFWFWRFPIFRVWFSLVCLKYRRSLSNWFSYIYYCVKGSALVGQLSRRKEGIAESNKYFKRYFKRYLLRWSIVGYLIWRLGILLNRFFK